MEDVPLRYSIMFNIHTPAYRDLHHNELQLPALPRHMRRNTHRRFSRARWQGRAGVVAHVQPEKESRNILLISVWGHQT